MNDAVEAAQEAAPEVVQSEEIEQITEAPEAAESTEGQVKPQPAEDDQSEEQKSEAAKRRERRKAQREAEQRELREAQEAAEKAKSDAERIKAAVAALKEPKQADYPDFESYQAALTAFHVGKGMDQRQIQSLEEAAKAKHEHTQALKAAQQQADAQNWAAQVAEAREKYPDFEEAMQVARNARYVSQELSEMIVGSDIGADVAYFLGKNPDVAQRLSAMTDPVSMARALGQVEARLSDPQPKTVSTAPAPINPVKGKSATPLKAIEDMTTAEYIEARKAGKL